MNFKFCSKTDRETDTQKDRQQTCYDNGTGRGMLSCTKVAHGGEWHGQAVSIEICNSGIKYD